MSKRTPEEIAADWAEAKTERDSTIAAANGACFLARYDGEATDHEAHINRDETCADCKELTPQETNDRLATIEVAKANWADRKAALIKEGA